MKKTANVRPPPDTPLTLVERMFFFRQTSNFAHASIEALADLVQDAPELRYEPGQSLWAVGEHATHLLVVLDGILECSAEGIEPFEFDRGYVVGGLDALSQSERWYAAQAKTALRVLRLPSAHMFDVLEDHVDMAMELVRSLAAGVEATLAAMAAAESLPSNGRLRTERGG